MNLFVAVFINFLDHFNHSYTTNENREQHKLFKSLVNWGKETVKSLVTTALMARYRLYAGKKWTNLYRACKWPT